MPGVDILMELGASDWTSTDATKLQHAQQRARFDAVGVASRRALTGDLAGGNAELKITLDTCPQLRGWAVINPLYPERSSEEMRRYLSSPKWLGAMLHPEFCGESLASAATHEVINAYRRYTKPLLVHVGNEESARQLEDLAKEFSSLKIIAAGAGHEDWQACMWAAKRAVNIYLEPFSGGAHRGKLETIFATLGPNRVLFASGFPLHNPGAALGLLMDAKITDTEKQAVLNTNPVRLFNLRGPQAEA
jgi:predicted TIM-barrel fold metal-dependent hydrolase